MLYLVHINQITINNVKKYIKYIDLTDPKKIMFHELIGEIKVVPKTKKQTRIFRKKSYDLLSPVVGTVFSVNGSGYGDGIHQSYVVTSIHKTKKGDLTSAWASPIYRYIFDNENDDRVTYDTGQNMIIKPKFSDGYARWKSDNKNNSINFDSIVTNRDDFPYGR